MYDNGFARAAEALRDAVADAATDPAVLVQSFLLLSFALVNTGDYDESLHYARQALTLAEELDVPALTSQVLAMWVTVALMCGQGVDEPRLQRALGLEDPDVDVPIPFRASAVNGLALAWTGRLDEARAQMRAVRNRCIERGAHTHIMFIALHSTLIDVWRAEFEEAALTAEDAIERAEQLAIGFRDGFTTGLAALGEVADDPRLARSNTVASIRADLLRRAGRLDEALEWYRIALDRNGSDPARAFLRRRVAECGGHR